MDSMAVSVQTNITQKYLNFTENANVLSMSAKGTEIQIERKLF